MVKERKGSLIAHSVSGGYGQEWSAGDIAAIMAALPREVTFAVKGAGTTVLQMDAVHGGILGRAILHGLVQRISDRAAMTRNPETGQPASPQDKLARMAAYVEHLNSGSDTWDLRSERVGTKADAGGTVLRAVAIVKGWTVEQARVRLDQMAAQRGVRPRAILDTIAATSQPVKDLLAKWAEEAREAARLAAERAGIDTEDLLDQMGELDEEEEEEEEEPLSDEDAMI